MTSYKTTMVTRSQTRAAAAVTPTTRLHSFVRECLITIATCTDVHTKYGTFKKMLKCVLENIELCSPYMICHLRRNLIEVQGSWPDARHYLWALPNMSADLFFAAERVDLS
jgi:hypothetical protein